MDEIQDYIEEHAKEDVAVHLLVDLTEDGWRARLLGEKGYFDTRIVFIAESGPKLARKKRLAVMDQDGANPRYLSRGEDLVLTPRFSPSSPRNSTKTLKTLAAQKSGLPAFGTPMFMPGQYSTMFSAQTCSVQASALRRYVTCADHGVVNTFGSSIVASYQMTSGVISVIRSVTFMASL